MTGFFQELAKKLAERWVAMLLVPGLLFVVGALLGLHLRHRHALDWTMAARHITDLASSVGRLPGGTQAVVIVGLLMAASAAGLVVQAMAGVTRRLFLGTWPWPLRAFSHWRIARRRARYDKRLARRRELEQAPGERTPELQETIDQAAAKVNALAMARPGSATWMGDRMHTAEAIARNRRGLDLAFAWPRLWLVLPDTPRTEITAAHSSFAGAVAVAAWAWPLFMLGAFWWLAAVVGAAVGATGWLRARSAIGDLATLTESAVDLYGRALGVELGVVPEGTKGQLTLDEGVLITKAIREGR